MSAEQKIVVNELLCFFANKVRSMTYDGVMKLCMDFYDEESVIAAKTVLLDHVTVPDTDDKKRKRIGLNKKTNCMKDILNIFLELTVEEVPLFVANNLNNLLPLSMDNFDMSRIIHDIEAMKMQLKILQEVQETSLAAQAALCHETGRVATRSPAHSTGTPPSPMTPAGSPSRSSLEDDTTVAYHETGPEHQRIDDDEPNDEDIIRLARIQGLLTYERRPPTTPRWPRYTSDTRASDLMDYFRREACLNLRCDPLATRHNSYRSYYVQLYMHHHVTMACC